MRQFVNAHPYIFAHSAKNITDAAKNTAVHLFFANMTVIFAKPVNKYTRCSDFIAYKYDPRVVIRHIHKAP